jgi:chaperone BCS1
MSALASSFSTALPEGRLSLASIQGYLLMHKRDPRAAVQDAIPWSERTLKEAAMEDCDDEQLPKAAEGKGEQTPKESVESAGAAEHTAINGEKTPRDDGHGVQAPEPQTVNGDHTEKEAAKTELVNGEHPAKGAPPNVDETKSGADIASEQLEKGGA